MILKKIIILFCILIAGNIALSEDIVPVNNDTDNNITLSANAEFNWINITQDERDSIISKYRADLFDKDTVYKFKRKTFKEMFKNFLKDSDYKRHYMLVSNDVRETNEENLCGFYRGKLLVSYAIQYKDDLKTVYYYDVLGNLRYVDTFSDNYPNFPYTSKQYRYTGNLISAIYFISHDLQYMYKNNETFRGIWYKDKMYNSKGKQILTRTNW